MSNNNNNNLTSSVDVEYPKAPLYKRWLACLTDIFLTAIIGLLLYILCLFVTQQIPQYKSVVEERTSIQIRSKLYDEDGELILNKMDESTSSYSEKKADLSSRIDYFYKDSDFFNDDEAYDNYEKRKEEAKDQKGNQLFVKENESYVEGKLSDETYYDFYFQEISDYALPLMASNATYQKTNQIIIWTSVIELFLSLGLSYFIFFNLVPLIMKRGRKTIGMYLLKISLISGEALNPQGKPWILRQFLIFFIGYVMNVFAVFIPLLVSLSMMHLSKTGQDFFDYMSGTYVVDTSHKDVYLSLEEYVHRNEIKEKTKLENKDLKLR